MRVLSGAGLFTAPGPDSGVHWAEHLRVNDPVGGHLFDRGRGA